MKAPSLKYNDADAIDDDLNRGLNASDEMPQFNVNPPRKLPRLRGGLKREEPVDIDLNDCVLFHVRSIQPDKAWKHACA